MTLPKLKATDESPPASRGRWHEYDEQLMGLELVAPDSDGGWAVVEFSTKNDAIGLQSHIANLARKHDSYRNGWRFSTSISQHGEKWKLWVRRIRVPAQEPPTRKRSRRSQPEVTP